jgi:hypothetical protein
VSDGNSPPAPERVRFIEHRGKQILYHDFSNIMDSDEALRAFAQSKALVAHAEPRSLLTLTTVANSKFNPATIAGLKDLAFHNKPFVRHGAVLAVTGLLKVIFVTVTQLTGRNMRSFDSEEEAKNWLVEQD